MRRFGPSSFIGQRDPYLVFIVQTCMMFHQGRSTPRATSLRQPCRIESHAPSPARDRRPAITYYAPAPKEPSSMIVASGGKTPRSSARLLPSTRQCTQHADPPIRSIRATTAIIIFRIVATQGGLQTVVCEPHENSPLKTPVFRPSVVHVHM